MRFVDAADNTKHQLLEAMKWEDGMLRGYIESCRLEEWYRTVVDAAESACQLALDTITAKGAKANGELSAGINGGSQGGAAASAIAANRPSRSD